MYLGILHEWISFLSTNKPKYIHTHTLFYHADKIWASFLKSKSGIILDKLKFGRFSWKVSMLIYIKWKNSKVICHMMNNNCIDVCIFDNFWWVRKEWPRVWSMVFHLCMTPDPFFHSQHYITYSTFAHKFPFIQSLCSMKIAFSHANLMKFYLLYIIPAVI